MGRKKKIKFDIVLRFYNNKTGEQTTEITVPAESVNPKIMAAYNKILRLPLMRDG